MFTEMPNWNSLNCKWDLRVRFWPRKHMRNLNQISEVALTVIQCRTVWAASSLGKFSHHLGSECLTSALKVLSSCKLSHFLLLYYLLSWKRSWPSAMRMQHPGQPDLHLWSSMTSQRQVPKTPRGALLYITTVLLDHCKGIHLTHHSAALGPQFKLSSTLTADRVGRRRSKVGSP